MALSSREQLVIQRYLVEGCSLPQLRRELKGVSVKRLNQIVAKAGRKALFYSDYFQHHAGNHGEDCDCRSFIKATRG